jgi:DNA-directed RNA polymerase specialized sigma24 family protein
MSSTESTKVFAVFEHGRVAPCYKLSCRFDRNTVRVLDRKGFEWDLPFRSVHRTLEEARRESRRRFPPRRSDQDDVPPRLGPPLPRRPGLPLPDPYDPLKVFHQKLGVVLTGGDPDLAESEKMWLRAFRETRHYWGGQLTLDESFGLSLEALWRCRSKGKEGHYSYVLKACVNAHRNHLRMLRRQAKSEAAYAEIYAEPEAPDPRAAADDRLDLKDALERVGEANPTLERAIRLRLKGHSFAQIGEALGVGEKRAKRLVMKASRELRVGGPRPPGLSPW